MRAFLWFLFLFLCGFAGMALLAYPAWELLGGELRFHRVASRVAMLTLLVGFVLLARRLGVADRASLGYGLPRREFLREGAIAFALGVALMLPVAAAMYVLDLRDPRPGLDFHTRMLAALALQGLMSGLAVALLEETFLRGAMFTAIARESGSRAAIALTALVYSATHFFARHRIPAEELNPWSGLEMAGGSLAAFAAPLDIADAFLSLAAVGVLLGLIRQLTGSIAACIGLHAGWVWVITVLRETSVRNESHPLAFLLSRHDGVVGWLVLAWTLPLALGLWWFYRRRQAEAEPTRKHKETLTPPGAGGESSAQGAPGAPADR